MATNTLPTIEFPHNAGIYAIIHMETQRRYVGSSMNIVKRWSEHRNALRALRHRNSKLQNAWNKYGADSFQFEVLQRVENLNDLIVCEQFFIDELKPFYNIRLVAAESNLGIKHSDEAKAKISSAQMGRVHNDATKAKMSVARKGIKFSAEHRAKISAANKGTIHSDEAKAKMSAAKNGMVLSDEAKAKISVALKGRVFSDETKAKMSAAGKGKLRSKETKAKIVATRKKNKEVRAAPTNVP